MEIKVNDYVRTNKGYITKIKKIIGIKEQSNKPYLNFNNCCVLVKNEDDCLGSKGKIIKSSSNIGKLLKVGDFIDGMRIIGIEDTTIHTLGFCFIDFEDVEDLVTSIVTKEMFEQIEYKIN